MQYVPAQDHSAALIAWLNARRYRCSSATFRECVDHVDRLDGHQEPHGYLEGAPLHHMRLLTPARADAWLREHVASEPTSLLRGVVL